MTWYDSSFEKDQSSCYVKDRPWLDAAGNRVTIQESVALIQTRGNDGLDKCSRSREEWLDSGFNLKVDAIVFLMAQMCHVYEQEESKERLQRFQPEQLEGQICHHLSKKDSKQSRFKKKNQEFCFGNVKFGMNTRYPSRDNKQKQVVEETGIQQTS